MLNHEQLSELRTQGHLCIRPTGTPNNRSAFLTELKQKYLVEEKGVYNTIIWIIKERK